MKHNHYEGWNMLDALRHMCLLAAFEAVADEEHWKNPVDKFLVVPHIDDVRLLQEAVRFFTATSPTTSLPNWEALGNPTTDVQVHITAPGYWAGPAA